MTVAQKRIGIIEKLKTSTDVKLLDDIAKLIKEHEELEKWLEKYPKEVSASIRKGIKQSENGQTIPHEEVMKKIEAWRKKYVGQRKQK